MGNSVDPDQMPHYVASDLGLHCCYKLVENSADPDQMPHSVASDLGLHCLFRPLSENLRQIWCESFLVPYSQVATAL